jgi:hypothetical protein
VSLLRYFAGGSCSTLFKQALADCLGAFIPLQQPAGKMKLAEVSVIYEVPVPATTRPARSSLRVERSSSLSAAEVSFAGTSRQHRPTEGGPAYDALVAGRAVRSQKSGPLKPKATCSGTPIPAASSEIDLMFMPLGDLSWTLTGMPARNTPYAPMDTNMGVPAGERQNKTPSMFQESRIPWLLGVVEGVMPQQPLDPNEGGQSDAHTKDGR